MILVLYAGIVIGHETKAGHELGIVVISIYEPHIHPLSRVDWDDVEQVKKVCHYTNLRPLLTELNLSKGNKLII
jgi:hypothetical protein